MKKNLLYLLLFISSPFFLTNCNDEDGLSFSITPAIGFAQTSAAVQDDEAEAFTLSLHSNVAITEEVTVTIAATELGLTYGVDYITVPAAVNGIITVSITSETENPGIVVTSLGNEAAEGNRKVIFEITSVTGNGLTVAQGAAQSFIFSITDKAADPNLLTISYVRSLYSGSAVDLAETRYIEGVVISTNDNVTAKNVFIQDASGGIVLRFNENNTTSTLKLVPGDFVRVPLSGVTLTAFNGLIQLGNGSTTLPHENIIKLGTEELPEPVEITVEELNSDDYQSMLVRVIGVTFAAANGTKTVSGNNTFSDGTNSATMRVESYAPFSGKVLPSGAVTITGVASYFNAAQILPMKESDIQ